MELNWSSPLSDTSADKHHLFTGPPHSLVMVAFVSAHTHLHSSPENLQAAFSPSLAWLCRHVLECSRKPATSAMFSAHGGFC